MNLKDYFDNTEGTGILSTADTEGNVDTAIYAAPHIMDADTIAFIMRPRRSYKNITSNPKAAYLYLEKGNGYKGKRLYLHKTEEDPDPDKVNLLRRSSHGGTDEKDAKLVYFKVTHVRPLIGDAKDTQTR